jgi:hypothetical protein
MKLTELRQVIKEEISKVLKENSIPQSEINYIENVVFKKRNWESNLEKNKQKLAKLIQFFNEADPNITYEEMIEKYGKDQADALLGFMFDLRWEMALNSKNDMITRLFKERKQFNF